MLSDKDIEIIQPKNNTDSLKEVFNQYEKRYKETISDLRCKNACNEGKIMALEHHLSRVQNEHYDLEKRHEQLIAASGNNGGQVIYPARYDSVVAVGATDQNNNVTSFSNYGSKLELVAPGFDILSTYLNNSYSTMTGTSMAAPHVSGAAALIWSANPGLTNVQVRQLLDQNATDLGTSGRDENYGFGLVNTYAALNNM